MPGTDIPMKEFLVWHNCGNHCKFCWQKKLNKREAILTEEEKLDSIAAVTKEIDSLGFTDILIVGGEVYCPHSPEVNDALIGLFNHIAERVRDGKTRQMYANTNMIYEDTTVLDGLIKAFEGIEDKLRLTTSYDFYGRYENEQTERMFLRTLYKTTHENPKINVVVNTILTSKACEMINTNKFEPAKFVNKYRIAGINFIPYIPLSKEDSVGASWANIVQALDRVSRQMPHYLEYYLQQLDWMQPRVLKEYHRGEGFVECTSSYMECGHNENYKLVADNGECYICLLKKTVYGHNPLTDEALRDYVDRGFRIVTVGDMCSSYVWTKFRQPDIVIFDDRFKPQDFKPVLELVRETDTRRIILNNPDTVLALSDEQIIRDALNGDKDSFPLAIQTTDEEDSVVYTCLAYAPSKWVVIYGDSENKGMKYFESCRNDNRDGIKG